MGPTAWLPPPPPRPSVTPPRWRPALSAARPDRVRIYVHGSAALNGFRAARSDVDVLAIVSGPVGRSGQLVMGEAMSATAAHCRRPFEVHIRTGSTGLLVVPGADPSADPGLLLHCAMCREHGHTVYGRPPSRYSAWCPLPESAPRWPTS